MSKLGIIAGSDGLPLTVARAFKGEVFVACIRNHAKVADYKDFSAEEFHVGHVGKILKFFKKHVVTNLVLAGAIRRCSFSDIAVDLDGAVLLTKIMANKMLGDDKLLRIVADHIESKDFKIHSPLDYIKNEMAQTKAKPSKDFLSDIEYTKNLVSKLGELDVGQAAIVERGRILGVEAAEGTDDLIKRCFSYTKEPKTSILVKMMKPNQDKRLDTPVIGIKTIENAINSDMAGIAIQRNSVILIEPEKIAKLADGHNFFIHLFD